MNETAEPLGDIANPAGFAVFAITDNVDADLGLPADNSGNLVAERPFKPPLIIGFAVLARP